MTLLVGGATCDRCDQRSLQTTWDPPWKMVRLFDRRRFATNDSMHTGIAGPASHASGTRGSSLAPPRAFQDKGQSGERPVSSIEPGLAAAEQARLGFDFG